VRPASFQRSSSPARLTRDTEIRKTIFGRQRRPMSRKELHAALDGIVRSWIASACAWKRDWTIGDYRFLVFSIAVAPRTEVYVQFWSEPFEPVSWEVSSGRWNPPADKWLAGDRSERISSFGFEIGGGAENFQREVTIASRADLTDVARTTVDILYAGFDYRGMQKLDAHLRYDSRAQMKRVLTSLTPEDVTKIFVAHGYTLIDDSEDDEAPILHFRAHGVLTTVAFGDRIPDQHLFESVALTSDVSPASADAVRVQRVVEELAPAGEIGLVQMGVTLHFGGGVTVDWISRRIDEWTRMISDYQRAARKQKRRPVAGASGVVH
jgi:hypothetical protein